MRDDAIDAIRDGEYNKRLLSEVLAHEKFRQLMIDAEVYVDRIADSRISDMNAMLEAVRRQTMEQYKADGGDLYMRTLESVKYRPRTISLGFFRRPCGILHDIREAHRKDATTADETSAAEEIRKRLQEAAHYEGSPQEKQAKVYLAQSGH